MGTPRNRQKGLFLTYWWKRATQVLEQVRGTEMNLGRLTVAMVRKSVMEMFIWEVRHRALS